MSDETEQRAPIPGRFVPGQSGNPRGRPPGSLNKATTILEELFDGEAEEVARRIIDKAKTGNMQALRICLEQIAPARRERPVAFELPEIVNAEDAERAGAALIAAVAAGELTSRQAAPVMTMIARQQAIIDGGSDALRMAEIEAWIQERGEKR
jgi:hypothetical protein